MYALGVGGLDDSFLYSTFVGWFIFIVVFVHFFRVILVARECSCVIFSDFFLSSFRSLFKLFNYFFQGGWKRRKN